MQTRVSQKAVILNQQGEILAIFRTETAPSSPSTWDFPGGELEAGEDPIESIRREIQEETGVEVGDLVPFDVESHTYEDEEEFWVTIVYKALAKNDVIKLSFEHNDFRWVSPEGFLKLESQAKLYRFARMIRNIRHTVSLTEKREKV